MPGHTQFGPARYSVLGGLAGPDTGGGANPPPLAHDYYRGALSVGGLSNVPSLLCCFGRRYQNKVPCQRHSKHGCNSGGPVRLFTFPSSKQAPRRVSILGGMTRKGP